LERHFLFQLAIIGYFYFIHFLCSLSSPYISLPNWTIHRCCDICLSGNSCHSLTMKNTIMSSSSSPKTSWKFKISYTSTHQFFHWKRENHPTMVQTPIQFPASCKMKGLQNHPLKICKKQIWIVFVYECETTFYASHPTSFWSVFNYTQFMQILFHDISNIKEV